MPISGTDACDFQAGQRIGIETEVGVSRSRPFWPDSKPELESVKFGRLRLRLRVAGDDDEPGRSR